MSAVLRLVKSDGQPLGDVLEMGETQLGEGDAGEGEVMHLLLFNDGDTACKDIVVGLEGEGANFVALAISKGGKPGVWTSPGEGIIPISRALLPGEGVDFYARTVFEPDDVEGTYDFEIIVQTTSVGD